MGTKSESPGSVEREKPKKAHSIAGSIAGPIEQTNKVNEIKAHDTVESEKPKKTSMYRRMRIDLRSSV